ncbi:MAG: hypothetical protein AAFR10_09605 [Pseudomonadota bacterium]
MLRQIAEVFGKYIIIVSVTLRMIRHSWWFGRTIESDVAEFRRSVLYLFEISVLAVLFGPMLLHLAEGAEASRYPATQPQSLSFVATEFASLGICLVHLLLGYFTYLGLCLFEEKPRLLPTMSVFCYWSGFFLIMVAVLLGGLVLLAELEAAIFGTEPCGYRPFPECPAPGIGLAILWWLAQFIFGTFTLCFWIINFRGFGWIGQANGTPGFRVYMVYLLVVLMCLFLLSLAIPLVSDALT